jgi:hypothetical protein
MDNFDLFMFLASTPQRGGGGGGDFISKFMEFIIHDLFVVLYMINVGTL